MYNIYIYIYKYNDSPVVTARYPLASEQRNSCCLQIDPIYIYIYIYI